MKKIAVITGASSGMGRDFVRLIDKHERFDEVWVIARRLDRLEALADECAFPTRAISLDLTDPAAYAEYAALLEEKKPNVALLVNCSGYGKFGRYDDIDMSDKMGMIDLNCKALVQLTELTLPYMNEGAHIIELDSLSSFQPVPYIGVYGATKAFVLSYSRSLNRELRDRKIRVCAVCPGWVRTEFFDRAKTKNEKAITYYNKVWESEAVVKTALRDAYRGKDVSIHGFRIRAQVLATKLLPHSVVMSIWLRQQGHK